MIGDEGAKDFAEYERMNNPKFISAEAKKLNAQARLKDASTKLITAQRKPQRNVFPQKLVLGENLSREQSFLNDLFGGNGTLGKGISLPVVSGVLRTGGGLINNGDYERNTGSMFGLRRRR